MTELLEEALRAMYCPQLYLADVVAGFCLIDFRKHLGEFRNLVASDAFRFHFAFSVLTGEKLVMPRKEILTWKEWKAAMHKFKYQLRDKPPHWPCRYCQQPLAFSWGPCLCPNPAFSCGPCSDCSAPPCSACAATSAGQVVNCK